MATIKLELPLVGVKFLTDSLNGFEDVEVFAGASYCDAVRNATFGKELVVAPGSIGVCRWSPIILGLKEAESDFENSLEPRLDSNTAGVYVAPLSSFPDGVVPDTVIVRGRPAQLREIAEALGPNAMQKKYTGKIGWSALGVGERVLSAKVLLSHASNRLLGLLYRSKWFDAAIMRLTKSEELSARLEKYGKNAVADMSICRNSSVMPYVLDAGNITYFCAGGVTWGGNTPANMSSGYPYRLIEPLLGDLDYPAK